MAVILLVQLLSSRLLSSPLAIRRLKGQPITPRAQCAVWLMKSGGRKSVWASVRVCVYVRVFFSIKKDQQLSTDNGEHTLAAHSTDTSVEIISQSGLSLSSLYLSSSSVIYHFSPRSQEHFSLPDIIFLRVAPNSNPVPLQLAFHLLSVHFFSSSCLSLSKASLTKFSFSLKGQIV